MLGRLRIRSFHAVQKCFTYNYMVAGDHEALNLCISAPGSLHDQLGLW